jgi:Predicted nucleotide-binding protein containing TIR-like domain
MSKRPLAFIGSSTEGLPVAKAIQAELQYCAECVIWSQGVFGLNEGPLEALVRALDTFDFAIFALTPDDLVASRSESSNAPRDNVLLELGLFIGRLGSTRTFIVVDRAAKLKLPSDLAGLTPATFEPPNSGTMQAAVGPACTAIERAMGFARRSRRLPVAIEGSFFQNAEGQRGIIFTVTNTGDQALPPYAIAIFHPKIGHYFIFPSKKTGPLLPGQKREHSCPVSVGGQVQDWMPRWKLGSDGQPLVAADDADFEFRLILEDSDHVVLFANKRIGRGLVRLMRQLLENGMERWGTWHDWHELSTALADE